MSKIISFSAWLAIELLFARKGRKHPIFIPFPRFMIILYEIMKITFLILTIVVAIFFLRGNYILPDATFAFLGKVLLPLYLIITGIMVGYLIAQVMIAKGIEETPLARIYVKSFTIGMVIGMIAAFLYIFLGN